MQSMTQYTMNENLIIKKQVPKVGVVCSNPRRVERIVTHLSNVVLLKEYQTAWQMDIYAGNYKGKSIFVAAIAVGAAGAAFALQQLAAAGARYIIRYGSNDAPDLTIKRMEEIVVVDRADNLYGLMQGSGAPQEEWGETLEASNVLISTLQQKADTMNLKVHMAICHHIEDYGAYAFPEKAGGFGPNVIEHLKKLHSKDNHRLHCRDMETAALFYRAKLDGFHAATVLQNIPKFRGQHQTYDGEQGIIAKQMEAKFCELIFSALSIFADVYMPDFRTYIELDEKILLSYLRALPFFTELVGSNELIIKRLVGERSNVFRVENPETGKSVIVRQMVISKENAENRDSMSDLPIKYEVNYIEQASKIIPNHTPVIYYSDCEIMQVLITRDFRKHTLMSKGVLNGICYPNFMRHVADYLATISFKCSNLFLSERQFFELSKKFAGNFSSPTSCFHNLLLSSAKQCNDSASENERSISAMFKRNAAELNLILRTRKETLVHGKMRMNSIMLNSEETCIIIGGESAFMGPMGFDIGTLLGDLILFWTLQQTKPGNCNYKDWLLSKMEQLVMHFNEVFYKHWRSSIAGADENLRMTDEFSAYQADYIKNLFHTVAGFAGLRIYGYAYSDNDVEQLRNLEVRTQKHKEKELVLRVGQMLVAHCKSFDDIKSVISAVCELVITPKHNVKEKEKGSYVLQPCKF